MDPSSTNLTFMWRNKEGTTLTHAFWSENYNDPKEVVFELFSRVAGKRDNLADVNSTLTTLALEAVKVYAAENNLDPTDFVAISRVILPFSELTDPEEQDTPLIVKRIQSE